MKIVKALFCVFLLLGCMRKDNTHISDNNYDVNNIDDGNKVVDLDSLDSFLNAKEIEEILNEADSINYDNFIKSKEMRGLKTEVKQTFVRVNDKLMHILYLNNYYKDNELESSDYIVMNIDMFEHSIHYYYIEDPKDKIADFNSDESIIDYTFDVSDYEMNAYGIYVPKYNHYSDYSISDEDDDKTKIDKYYSQIMDGKLEGFGFESNQYLYMETLYMPAYKDNLLYGIFIYCKGIYETTKIVALYTNKEFGVQVFSCNPTDYIPLENELDSYGPVTFIRKNNKLLFDHTEDCC